MADPSTYRPRAGEIPTTPGVYRFRDDQERVIYVGKARDLRQRLNSYFANLAGLHPRTQNMVTTAARVEWTVVANEVEALQLEYAWIKEYDPRFNVKYRDDKSYPYLAVTMGEEFPRVQVLRGAKRKGTRYFGPYAHAWAIRETVDLLLRVFPVRTCKPGIFRNAHHTGRPCLLGYIDKCSAPCVGRVTPEEHKAIAADFCDFVGGNTQRFVKRVETQMKEASAELDFERAARLRDDLAALTRAMEKSAVVLADGTDADVFALADDELEAAVQVFHVRDGRVRGQRGWVVEKAEPLTTADLVEHLLQQVYGDASADAVPHEVLVPELPSDAPDVERWLTTLRGRRVEVRVPQRGDKRNLMETVENNAKHSLALHKLRRGGDLTSRSVALQELQEALDLPEAPLRIECYDISNIQGEHVVGSMVVFEDGLPRKAEYRKFTVRGDGGLDDVASIHEVISRRFRTRAEADEARRFAYRPNLLVVDGGPPQVAAAARAMAEAGVTGVALCGLAKRLEEVWLPGDDQALVLGRTSEGLYLLQRVRDEAHRFAITHHRQRRSAAMTVSELDSVPGLGPARKKALLNAFGSLKKLRAASVEQIASVQGVGPKVALSVMEALAANRAAVTGDDLTIDMATGEIIDA